MTTQVLPLTGLEKNFGVVNVETAERRLSPATRKMAARFLAGEMGLAMGKADFVFPENERAGLSADMAYAEATWRIAAQSPLRVLGEEKLVGAATLLEATWHLMPVLGCGSTSHTTIGFDAALKCGYRGLRQQIEARLARGDLGDRQDFLKAMLRCLDAADLWHQRHLAVLQERIAAANGPQKQHYQEVFANLRNVPANAPTSFREAVQALWFMWSFQRLCGNWSGLGRIDKILGPHLQRDLQAGVLTLEEARELLAHFWIKGCEWIGCAQFTPGSGDAQFYQNIVLGGIDEAGNPVVNEVTFLVLDVVEELHISDFPIAVRVNSQTPEKLWRRIAQVQRLGGGIVAIYNEELILEALTKFGYAPEEARDFANDGCWEVMIPGKTAFSYCPFDMLKILQNALGLGPDNNRTRNFADFTELYQAFLQELAGPRGLEACHAAADKAFQAAPEAEDNGQPAPLLSLLVEGCIEKGRGYYNLGARYSVRAIHAGGIPDTANSLLVLKKLVYDDKRLTLPEFLEILRGNWDGHECLRQEIRQTIELYGNDETAADAMIRQVYDDYVRLGSQIRERHGVLRPLGISTFGREIEFRAHRKATPFGSKEGAILATNLAPTPGTDKKGPTAVIRSFCGMDFTKLPNGVPLELKIMPGSVAGESGINALVALMRTFVNLGGVFLHIDVVDSAMLKDAQAHPEKYPNLSVRISGWSARFATLNRSWQEMVIQRTQQVMR
ncbi:MAG: pyruvate formate lyase family protein [Phycisphaerae bacterium]